jgi:hypothetical protein
MGNARAFLLDSPLPSSTRLSLTCHRDIRIAMHRLYQFLMAVFPTKELLRHSFCWESEPGELVAQADLAASQNKLSTIIVLMTAPLNAHQCSCTERKGKVPTIRRITASAAADAIPQGVWTCAIAC